MLRLTRWLIPALMVVALPAMAQQHTATNVAFNPNAAAISPAVFAQSKMKIDSVVAIADAADGLDHAAFGGKTRLWRYRVECHYNTATKEICKANFLFITDSLNFRKIYYFKNNNLIKITEDSTVYYQVGDHLINDQGGMATPTVQKILLSVITDTWQGIYAALFP